MTFKQTMLFFLGILVGTLGMFIWMMRWDWRDTMVLVSYMVVGLGALATALAFHDECKKEAWATFLMGCAAGVFSAASLLLMSSAHLFWKAWYEKGFDWLR